MILAVDVGNSNIVLGCLDKENIYFEGRLSTDRSKTDMEYAVMFKNILDIHGIDQTKLKGAIISSVVPELDNILKRAINAVTGVEPCEVNAKNSGLKITVDKPDEVGSDLIVSAVASMREFKPPMIIIDMGTATTISVIDKEENFCGGAIIPGVKISQEALFKGTSQLPGISVEKSSSVIGTNTIDCMKSGMVFGTASMLDGMIERIEEELGEKTTVIATGGLSAKIIPHCKREIILKDNLLIRGLYILWEKRGN